MSAARSIIPTAGQPRTYSAGDLVSSAAAGPTISGHVLFVDQPWIHWRGDDGAERATKADALVLVPLAVPS